MRQQGRLFLYFLAGAVVVTALSVGIFLTIAPGAGGSNDTSELTSSDDRIRIVQVDSFTGFHGSDGQLPEDATPTLSAIHVPSYLPDGFRHSHTRLMTKTSVGQLFEGKDDAVLMVVQSPSATQTVKAGFVESIDVNGRSGFLIQGSWKELDSGTPTWDQGMRTTLLLEMEDSVVGLLAEDDSVSKQDLVRIGESLEPNPGILSRLLEESAHPQRIADELPSSFGALYMPSYLPDGYVAHGGEARPEWGLYGIAIQKLFVVRAYHQPTCSRLSHGPRDRAPSDVRPTRDEGRERQPISRWIPSSAKARIGHYVLP